MACLRKSDKLWLHTLHFIFVNSSLRSDPFLHKGMLEDSKMKSETGLLEMPAACHLPALYKSSKLELLFGQQLFSLEHCSLSSAVTKSSVRMVYEIR